MLPLVEVVYVPGVRGPPLVATHSIQRRGFVIRPRRYLTPRKRSPTCAFMVRVVVVRVRVVVFKVRVRVTHLSLRRGGIPLQ